MPITFVSERWLDQGSINIGAKLSRDNQSTWKPIFPKVNVKLETFTTSEEEVVRLIKNIKIHKSSGYKGINSRVMKDAFGFLSKQITYMFKTSLDNNSIPTSWKEATIIPIPKDGNLTLVENYRPISLLPLPSKLLEKIVHRNISDFLEEHNILTDIQGGYRKGLSTIHTIGDLTDDILRERNIGKETLAVFIDLKKAFDTLDHSILLRKCDRYGIVGKAGIWLTEYLRERKQSTLANGIKSKSESIVCGVPQGSVLGPLLFLLYVNELDKVCKHCKVLLYADDTVLYVSGNDQKDLAAKMQEDLDRYYDWCYTNRLTINSKKTKYMCFTSKVNWFNCRLSINGEKIYQVDNYKYLGVILDQALSYEKFVKSQLKTTAFRTYQLARLNPFVDIDTAILLYKTYVLPILEYGDVLYAGVKKDTLRKIQKAQNRGLKVAQRTDYLTPTYDIHARAKLNMLEDRLYVHQLKEAFIRCQKPRYRDNRNLVTRAWDGPILKCYTAHSCAYTRSLEHSLAFVWNDLIPADRMIDSLDKFKVELYKFLDLNKPKVQR